MFINNFSDKQQEVDVPFPKLDGTPTTLEGPSGRCIHNDVTDVIKKDRRTTMSQISGIRRLTHNNSFIGVVPKYGVVSSDERELDKVGMEYVCDKRRLQPMSFHEVSNLLRFMKFTAY